MGKTTIPNFDLFNSLRNSVMVLTIDGRIVFANKAFQHIVTPGGNNISIFDLLEDHRLVESLKNHMQVTSRKEFYFSAVIKEHLYRFDVTRLGEYFICNGHSENEIESMYQLQVLSQKKMLDIKSRLLSISMLDKSDFDKTIETILATASEILDCERISFWDVNDAIDTITCRKLFLQKLKGLAPDIAVKELTRKQSPAYFDHVNKEYAFIMADDIATHPATKEFYESYSKPLNLRSLLDVPVWHNGRLTAIICCEQVGLRKRWKLEDIQFMLSLADNAALAMQTRDRMATEKLLHETNYKLERSNADLENFAAVAAHDLKSPLRSMVSFLSLLKKNHSNLLDESGKEYIDFTLQNATHLTNLINDLLAYSKLEQTIGETAEVNVGELIADILKDQQDFINERNAQVVLKGDMPTLHIYRSLLYQLFSNIIHNAIKYSHTHQPPLLEITVSNDTRYYHFEFADNGIGVDDQYAEKIFSLFHRLHSAEQYDGTGIGLATCKKIAELFGGKINYRRRQNPEGSIFTVLLPATFNPHNGGPGLTGLQQGQAQASL